MWKLVSSKPDVKGRRSETRHRPNRHYSAEVLAMPRCGVRYASTATSVHSAPAGVGAARGRGPRRAAARREFKAPVRVVVHPDRHLHVLLHSHSRPSPWAVHMQREEFCLASLHPVSARDRRPDPALDRRDCPVAVGAGAVYVAWRDPPSRTSRLLAPDCCVQLAEPLEGQTGAWCSRQRSDRCRRWGERELL